jgi:hypothetical protein
MVRVALVSVVGKVSKRVPAVCVLFCPLCLVHSVPSGQMAARSVCRVWLIGGK